MLFSILLIESDMQISGVIEDSRFVFLAEHNKVSWRFQQIKDKKNDKSKYKPNFMSY